MKKLITISLLLVIMGGSGMAQPYESVFGTSSTRWEVSREYYRFDHYTFTTKNKDTLIHSKFYKEISEEINVGFFSNLYMREDTVTGKLWIYEPDNDEEYLIMDLSLNVGDSFFLPSWTEELIYTEIDTVLVVDSVFIINGRKHILFKTELKIGSFSPWVKLQFVEGIGPNAGLRYLIEGDRSYNNWVTNNLLLCKYTDEVRKYHDSINSSEYCTLIVIGNNENDKQVFQLYPNPVNERLFIEMSNQSAPVSYDFFNQQGLRVKSIKNTYQTEIQVSDLCKGFYLLRITESSGNRIHFKILKQ